MKNFLMMLIILALIAPDLSAKRPSFPPKDDPHKRNEWLKSTYANPKDQESLPNNIDELQRDFARKLPVANEGFRTKGSQIQSQTWLNAGPNNIGGRTRAVAYDVNNPNILIAGGVSGGIWRSVDGGQSWVQTSSKNEVASVTAIAQDTRPGKTNIWYYGGGEIIGNTAGDSKRVSHYSNGIYKSTDNGLTWNPLESTYEKSPQKRNRFDNISRLVLDHTNMDKDIVYAACLGAVYRSEDGGETWEGVLGSPDNPSRGSKHIDLIINNDGTLYAALNLYSSSYSSYISNQSGFFRSTDGKNWEDITPEGFYGEHIRTVIASGSNDDALVYFLTAHNSDNSIYCPQPGNSGCHSLFILQYSDSPSWTDASNYLPEVEGKFRDGFYESQYGYDMCIAVKPDNEDIVIIGGTNLFISDFAFFNKSATQWVAGYSPNYDPTVFGNVNASWNERMQSWRDMMFPTGGWDFHTLVFHPTNPDIMLTGSDHGIHRISELEDALYNENFVWDDLNNGYNTTQFYDCSIHPTEAGNDLIIGGMQDNGTWATFSSDVMFTNLTGGDGMHSAISSQGDVLVSSQYGNMMRLIYEGDEIVDGYFLQPYSSLKAEFNFYAPFEINPNDRNGVAMGGRDEETNFGMVAYCPNYLDKEYGRSNWHKINFGTYHSATVLAFAESQEYLLYVGTSSGSIIKIDDVRYPSSEKTIIPFPAELSYAYTSDLWVNPVDANNIIAILSNYNSKSIIETTDGGENWTDHGGNLEENEDGSGNGPSFRAYARLNSQGNKIHFVGTSAGLYSTTKLDGANTVWVREGESTIGMAVVSQIHARQSDRRIVVSTHGSGIFKTNYSVSVDEFDGHNLGFVVSEVYPNPTSEQINFVLNSDDASFVEAKIVDIQGNLVAKIISEQFSGTRKITFNASNLTQGTYFINISNGTQYITKKVNIVK